MRDLAGRHVRRLTYTPRASASQPAVSPDGKVVAFIRTAVTGRATHADVWQVSMDGTGLRRLTFTKGIEASPTFKLFAPSALVYERDGSIYSYGTRRPVARGTEPATAPGSGLLAFARDGAVYVVRPGEAARLAAGSLRPGRRTARGSCRRRATGSTRSARTVVTASLDAATVGSARPRRHLAAGSVAGSARSGARGRAASGTRGVSRPSPGIHSATVADGYESAMGVTPWRRRSRSTPRGRT